MRKYELMFIMRWKNKKIPEGEFMEMREEILQT